MSKLPTIETRFVVQRSLSWYRVFRRKGFWFTFSRKVNQQTLRRKSRRQLKLRCTTKRVTSVFRLFFSGWRGNDEAWPAGTRQHQGSWWATLFQTTGQVLCDVIPCYGGSAIDLLSTIEKQLSGVSCKTPLETLRSVCRDQKSRNILDMYLYTSDGGPDEASYKRMMVHMMEPVQNIIFEHNDCVKHKVIRQVALLETQGAHPNIRFLNACQNC